MKCKFLLIILFANFFGTRVFSQWMQLTQDTNNMNCSVFFINPDTGFIAGNYGNTHLYIQRTTDGGQTWDSTYIQNGITLMSVCFPNDTIGYCGGQNGAVYKTTNMGLTWLTATALPNSNDLGELFFLNKDTGFAADFNGRIFRTTDGAVNWTMVSPPQNSFQNFYPGTGKFQFANDSIGFLADGNYGIIRKTIDYGSTWTSINLPSSNTWALSMYMFNKDTGIVTAENGKVWKTINGGTSWTGPVIISSYDLLDVTFFNDSLGYIVGGENNNYVFHPPLYPPVGAVIYVTANGGNTWNLDTSFCCDWLTSISNAGNNIAYAVGWHGWLFKNTNVSSLAAVNENSVSSSIKIYPNPVFDIINFPSSTHARLFDLTGRIIISEENKSQLDLSKVSNGMYLLQIENGEMIYSLKIIIRH